MAHEEEYDAVLRHVCNDRSDGLTPGSEEADRALAKRLQEQERAFLLLDRQRRLGPGENVEPATSEDDEGGSEVQEAQEGETDESFVLRLQQQEEMDHYQRLAHLSGLGDAEYSDDGYVTEDSVDPDDMTYEELQALGEVVGTVSRGAPPSLVEALPTIPYSAAATSAGIHGAAPPEGKAEGLDKEQCAVCRVELEEGDSLSLLPCAHAYHPDCIKQWLQVSKACPICGKELQPADPPPSAEEQSPMFLL